MKTFTKDMILDALDRSPKFVERSLLALYERQTADEQDGALTAHQNGAGFSGPDAFILTEFSKWCLRSQRPEGERLTPKQLELTRKKLTRYTRQLIEVAEERQGRAAA